MIEQCPVEAQKEAEMRRQKMKILIAKLRCYTNFNKTVQNKQPESN